MNLFLFPSPLSQLRKLTNELYYKNMGAAQRRKADMQLLRVPKPIYGWHPDEGIESESEMDESLSCGQGSI